MISLIATPCFETPGFRRSLPRGEATRYAGGFRGVKDSGSTSYTDGFTDFGHRALHGGEEGGAGVFHQMPSIGDLNGIRPSLGGGLPITGASVARDIVIDGRSASHAVAVAASRSGRISMTRRRSRSQMIVP